MKLQIKMLSLKISISPGLNSDISEQCSGRTPKSPSIPGTTTISTSDEKIDFSGEIRSKVILFSIMFFF